ncbi:hypothetical protein DFR58_104186 [Anaerobacterium chartisolvens]|uniref:Uncharacterized protein n=1 Tax=Anaerobacterium chartisolvens TaxID=1297424 RepID=A0A369BC39_9FIRM|nr:hypothetical protein [Anaerobacterium chartisolvens]RCX18915.1 hypothetical protein DFR58_104186 [Anaerobacterium chartisolvens]
MKQAVEGIYDEGKVILNEQVPIKGKSKVLVVFLEDYQGKSDRKKRLMETFGTWDDNKSADDTIDDIYSSRASREGEIGL